MLRKDFIEGQMSLFDLPQFQDNFGNMTIKKAAEIIERKTGIKFAEEQQHRYIAKKKDLKVSIEFKKYEKDIRNGIRFLSVDYSFKTQGGAASCESIEKAVGYIQDKIDNLVNNICKFSKHTCNKEELWRIAAEFDNIRCPNKCCRKCEEVLCGARCNGSEEPKVQQPKCTQANECEAYGFGCGGTVEPCRFGGPYKWTAVEVDIRGICDDGYCPKCGILLNDLIPDCPDCHTKLDWSRWKKLNEVE